MSDLTACVVCADELADADPAICHERCLSKVREDLAGVVLLWQELPDHLGHARSQRYDSSPRGGGDEHPLPGGEILALLGPGSSGQEPRRLTASDRERAKRVRWWVLDAQGPLTPQQWNVAVAHAEGKEHLADNAADESISVAEALASWERDLRDHYGEPPATTKPQRTAVVVTQAAGYLERRLRWAAGGLRDREAHPAFDELADDLRKLHVRLEVATGRVRTPVKANAACFDCGHDLVRRLRPTAVEQWWVPGAIGPMPQVRIGRGLVEETVQDLCGVEVPVWTCSGCGQRYDKERYNRALAAELATSSRLEVEGESFATTRLVAGLVGRSESTIKRWVREGVVRSVQHHGLTLASVDDAERANETRPRRSRSGAESHQCA